MTLLPPTWSSACGRVCRVCNQRLPLTAFERDRRGAYRFDCAMCYEPRALTPKERDEKAQRFHRRCWPEAAEKEARRTTHECPKCMQRLELGAFPPSSLKHGGACRECEAKQRKADRPSQFGPSMGEMGLPRELLVFGSLTQKVPQKAL